jgi:hypothetical protein
METPVAMAPPANHLLKATSATSLRRQHQVLQRRLTVGDSNIENHANLKP